MKPINRDQKGCDPMSSSCVIWQGPDLKCIDLCKGDTIDEVTFKLAEELCKIIDTLDISDYDISCFNLTSCAPEDFQALIQLLIDRICALENIPPTTPTGTAGCPDCTVSIADCFQTTNNLGDLVTSMQLTDYVHAIGNRLCALVASLNTNTRTLNNHNARITNLEKKPEPKVLLPEITPACVLPNTSAIPIDVILQALESQFCELRGSTGKPDEIFQSISKQPIGLGEAKQLSSNANMGAIPGWVNDVKNFADSFVNMWLTIADLRKAVQTIQLNCCPSGCNSVEIFLTVVPVDANTIKLYISGTIPSGFLQCNPAGTRFTVKDSLGGSFTLDLDLSTQINQPGGTLVALNGTPVNSLSDITVYASPCFNNIDTNTTCQSYITYTLVNQSACPVVTLESTDTTITYSFTNASGSASYIIELWDASNSTLVSAQTKNLSGTVGATGTFSTLTQNTNYNLRLKITSGLNTTICPFYAVSTLPGSCPAPEDSTAELDY